MNSSKLVSLFKEIREENLNAVKEIILQDSSILNEYLYGVTPFIYSVECERESIAIELLNYPDLDLNLRDNLGDSCLSKAFESKLYKLAEMICSRVKKTVINEILYNNETLLTSCIKADDEMGSIILIKGDVDINQPNSLNEYPMELVVKHNKMEILKSMLNHKRVFLGTLSNGYSPLLDACEKDLTEIAVLLIENGSELNLKDSDQEWTPLMHAICNNNEIIALKLIENNCNVNTKDLDGNTPLHLAVLNENDYILKFLLKSNATKDVKNNDNLTPLSIAKMNEDEACIKLLS